MTRKARAGHRVVPQSDSPRAAVLRDLLAVAEQNFVLFRQLMPAMRERDERTFALAGPGGRRGDIRLLVRERGPFTTLVEVAETRASDGWVEPMSALVRVSHDAQVAEIVEFRRRRRLQARYAYPNVAMYQPDEKLQVNRFLGEWLAHCLRWGEAPVPCAS